MCVWDFEELQRTLPDDSLGVFRKPLKGTNWRCMERFEDSVIASGAPD